MNKKRKRKKKRRRVVAVPPVPNLRIEGAAHNGVGDGGNVVDNGDDGAASDSSVSSIEPDQKYLGKSSYGSARSALVHLYCLCGGTILDDFQEDMATFMKGVTRKVAIQKEESGSRTEEGKAVMSFKVYQILYQLLLASDDDESIFGHLFLTLE